MSSKGHKLKNRKFNLNIAKHFVNCEAAQTPKQVSERLWSPSEYLKSFEISKPQCSPGQTALAELDRAKGLE